MENRKKILEALDLVLPMNKQDVSDIMSDFIDNVSEGIKNPVDAFIIAKKLSHMSDVLIEFTKQFVEIDNEEEKHGVKLTNITTGVRYDFSNCNHPEWSKFNETLKETKEEMSAIEKELKAMKEGRVIVNEETGETFRLNMPIKKGTQSVKFEWKE